MHPLPDYLRSQFAAHADADNAQPMQAYMKTTQPFYGIKADARRKLVREALRTHPVTTRGAYDGVVRALWHGTYREEMYAAVDIAKRVKAFYDTQSWPLFEHMVRTATWWDLTDAVVGDVISPLVKAHRELEAHLIAWSHDDSLWVRRASLLAHLKHKSQTNTALLTQTIDQLAHEKEFFIRKAIGWVLRDYSYANPAWVKAFVAARAETLSGLSQREALKVIKRHEQQASSG
jgi:3-methyladenine DNA glycosylase AlkD